jgi:hypothetical protein
MQFLYDKSHILKKLLKIKKSSVGKLWSFIRLIALKILALKLLVCDEIF